MGAAGLAQGQRRKDMLIPLGAEFGAPAPGLTGHCRPGHTGNWISPRQPVDVAKLGSCAERWVCVCLMLEGRAG